MMKVQDLCSSYKGKNAFALNDVSFSLEKGQILVLLGKNGVGKSTLLKTLLGLVKISKGSIEINEKPCKSRIKQLAYLPQNIIFPSLTVLECAVLGRLSSFAIAPSKEDYQIALECLEKVGIAHLHDRDASTLSGGEKQKLALARAFSSEASYLLFDEPSSNLDIASRRLLLKLAKQAKKEGKGVLISLHDIDDALEIGDAYLLMKEDGKTEYITNEELNEAHIRSLFGVNAEILIIDGYKKVFIKE